MIDVKIIIRNILLILAFILLGGAIIFLIYTGRHQESTQSMTVEEVQEEAKPYENELQELESELKALENGVSYSSDEAKIIVGFVVTDASDISYINDKADTYSFSPVLVIDCTMEMDVIEEIVEKADESWEIMLYAAPFSEETNEEVASVISYLKSAERDYADIFFLRSDYYDDANIKLLKKDGFDGYTVYHSETPKSGQTDSGEVYFDYSYLSSSGTSISSRISALYENKTAMVIAFSMSSINAESMSDSYVESTLNNMENYANNSDFTFATVDQVVEELSEINDIEAENQDDFEKQSAEIQERMDELEEIIDNIYDKLEY